MPSEIGKSSHISNLRGRLEILDELYDDQAHFVDQEKLDSEARIFFCEPAEWTINVGELALTQI